MSPVISDRLPDQDVDQDLIQQLRSLEQIKLGFLKGLKAFSKRT